MELKGKIINFLGDSITEGTGTSCTEAMYTEVLKREAGLAEIRNYGIGGTRIAEQGIDVNGWLDERDFCRRYKTMDDKADIIVVFGGTNDYGHGDAPFGCFEDRTMDTYCGAVHYLMRGLIEKYPASQIVFVTPLHREAENTLNASNHLPLKAYADKIRETAEYYSIPVLDLYANGGIYADCKKHRDLYMPDGLHPNDTGAKKVAEKMLRFLENL